jgi:hypothetical protein
LIGNLHPTLYDRAIPIRMRRRRHDEKIESLRMDRIETFEDLKRRCIRWARDHIETLKSCDPSMPVELHDRAADNWRFLVAIADLAGRDWPTRARQAAVTFTDIDAENEGPGILLLADIRQILREHDSDRIPSSTLTMTLGGIAERPWADWKLGRPINARQIARLLAPFGIRPAPMRIADKIQRGYTAEDFEDAFSRYLPAVDVTV